MVEPLHEILTTTHGLMRSDWPRTLWIAIAAMGAGYSLTHTRFFHEPGPKAAWFERLLFLVVLALGLFMALSRISVADDTYISCRYARNLIEGHGLVYNIGERVEGYTNFLWTLLIAFFYWITSWDAPFLAVVASLVAYAVNLWVVFRIGCALHVKQTVYIPIAALLLAAQVNFATYATTGLETAFGSLMVNLGAWFVIKGIDARRAFWAGTFLILAACTRPDHGLFYAAGGVAVLAGIVLAHGPTGPVNALIRQWKVLAAYAAPFAGYLGLLAWKFAYYGSIVPNTYYAKSAGLPYWDQGVIYAAVFYLLSHFWLVALLFAGWFLWPGDPNNPAESRFKVFAAVGFVLWNVYQIRLGGDYIHSRFFIVLIPLLLLGAERFVYGLAKRARSVRGPVAQVAFLLSLGLLVATAHGIDGTRVFTSGPFKWKMTDQLTNGTISVEHLSHLRHREANADPDPFIRFLAKRRVPVCTPGIGSYGYKTRLTIIGMHGLTDATIARMPVSQSERGVPGHEKGPTLEYLRSRRVLFAHHDMNPPPSPLLKGVQIVQQIGGTTFFGLIHDPVLMRDLLDGGYNIEMQDFEARLDQYIAQMGDMDAETVRADYGWLQRFYFDFNDDPARKQAIEAYLGG